MKVLKDNYKKAPIKEVSSKFVCEHCDSELEYDSSDIEIGEYGCAFVECPLCGYKNYIFDGEYEMVLTAHNVEFPVHFHHTSTETGAVDHFNNNQIKECIHKAIEYFRKNKNENYWFTEFGNLHVSVSRWDGDESYEVVATNNFYNTCIPFEEEDY